MLKAVHRENVIRKKDEGKDRAAIVEERKQRYLDKPLHGQFFKNTEEVRDKTSWQCLKRGRLKKERQKA